MAECKICGQFVNWTNAGDTVVRQGLNRYHGVCYVAEFEQQIETLKKSVKSLKAKNKRLTKKIKKLEKNE